MSEATYKKVTLNGEDHVLKFDFNGISELEQFYNKGIHGIVTDETIGFNTVRNIFWAGMLWKNPSLKPFHVGKMLQDDLEKNEEFDFEKLTETAIDALFNSKAFKLLSNNKNEKN
ncbi:hypothetical protein QFZ28_004364 [Neobacillus niacini]|uniref:hypothetical protein n=1 Tax=Neobacillus niacini TaxID=86668 RepID=UPI00277F7B1B|nr:hypothetical protein [Neobacillus niacini]MDQ1003964.1 hypothetical protein [Neobacillus niacini]